MKKYRLNDFINNTEEKITITKPSSSNKGRYVGKRIKSFLLAATLGLAGIGAYDAILHNGEESIYTAKITDTNDVDLRDENGNVIVTFPKEDGIENEIIVFDNPKDKEKSYKAIVVDNESKFVLGYLDGKDILDDDIDKYSTFYNDTDEYEIAIVSAQNGVYVRDKKVVDKNTDRAELLEPQTYILAGKKETSTSNSYMWNQVLYYDDETDELKFGYMVSDYIFGTENLDLSREFKVQNTRTGLSFRTTPSRENNDNKFGKINENDIIYVVPNIEGHVDEDCDWIYVAHHNEATNDWELGWVAATQRFSDGSEVQYLVKTHPELSEANRKNNDEYQVYVVDTSHAKHADLKLREAPGTDSKIKVRIEDGTEIYVLQSDIDNLNNVEEVNGYRWIEIKLKDGTKGYVASEYLREKEDKEIEAGIEISKNVQIHNEGRIDGVLGIDVDPNTMSIGEFEELIKGNTQIISTGTNGNLKGKVNYVYIKMGASSYGMGAMKIIDPDTRAEKAANFSKLCDEYGIPYGFYYYSQAVTSSETQAEIDYIEGKLPQMSGALNVLPLALDVEYNSHNGKPERLSAYVSQEHDRIQRSKKLAEITKLKIDMQDRLEQELGKDVTFYINNEGLNTVVDYDKLSEEQKKELWVVDLYDSSTHSSRLMEKKIVPGVEQRQLNLGELYGLRYDIDIMDIEALEKYLDKAGIKYSQKGESMQIKYSEDLSR